MKWNIPKSQGKKNMLMAALVLLALGIWSYNIYSIFTGVAPSADEEFTPVHADHEQSRNPTAGIADTDTSFVYRAVGRDPFQHWLSAQKPKSQKPMRRRASAPKRPPTKKAPPPLPELRFSGVLRDSTGVLAIIEDALGVIHFVTAGDTVQGVVIRKVVTDTVFCRFGERRFMLRLR